MKIQIKSSELLILLAASTMSFLANLPDSILGNLVDRKTLLITLTALVAATMLRYLQMTLLLAISIFAIGANLPEELASALGVSQLTLLVSLGIMATILLLNRAIKLLPTDKEISPIESPYTRQDLLAAIAKGDLIALRRLLSVNVNLNFIENGTTPLHMAAAQGNLEIVRLLIAQGADFRKNNLEGKSVAEVMREKMMFTQMEGEQPNSNKTSSALKNLSAYAQTETRRGDNESWNNQRAKHLVDC